MSKNQQLLAKVGEASLVLLLSFTVGQQAHAATVVSNLSEPNLNVTSLGFSSWQGSSFTTGNGSYNLDFVNLFLGEQTASSNFFVRLYSNNSGVPGTILTSFTPNAPITTTLAVNQFNPSSVVPLAANSTYWLVAGVSANDGGSYSWGYTSSFNETGVSGWTIGNGYDFSSSQGTTWVADPNAGPYQFSVNATEGDPPLVPEPSSVMGLLGLGGLGLVSRIGRKK